MEILFFILLIISIFVESTFINLPLVFILLVVFCILKKSGYVFLSAFLAGILLDLTAVRFPGTSSIFFLLVLLMIMLYQRKYEINSYPFILVSSFVGTYMYLIIFNKHANLLQPFLCTILALVLYSVLQIREVRSNN